MFNTTNSLRIIASFFVLIGTSHAGILFYSYNSGSGDLYEWPTGTDFLDNTNGTDVSTTNDRAGFTDFAFDGTFFYSLNGGGNLFRWNSALDFSNNTNGTDLGFRNDAVAIAHDGTFFYSYNAAGDLFQWASPSD